MGNYVKTHARKNVANGTTILLGDARFVSMLAIVCLTAATAAAAAVANTDVSTAAETLTKAGHGYQTGILGRIASSGTLPAGLTAGTDYYVIRVDDNTFRLATSLANAEAGTAVNLTSQGTGTHTFTPTAFADLTITLEGANAEPSVAESECNWVPFASATAIASAGVVAIQAQDFPFARARVKFAASAGAAVCTLDICGKSQVG